MTDAIERAARAMWRSDADENYAPQSDRFEACLDPEHYRSLARTALAAAMPVVDTAEALDALPRGSKLLAADGKVWTKQFYNSAWRSTANLTRRAEVLVTMKSAHPLRVIWTPEVTP